MPDWLESRLRSELSSWEVPPTPPRAALYRRPSAARRSGRLAVAMAAAALAAALGSIQAGAVPGLRAYQLVTRMAEERPVLPVATPTPPPLPAAEQAPEPAPATAYIPPPPSRGITKVPAPGGRPGGPDPKPSASPSPSGGEHGPGGGLSQGEGHRGD